MHVCRFTCIYPIFRPKCKLKNINFVILQNTPPPYPGNAPFPLAFGIPDTEPVDQSLNCISAETAMTSIQSDPALFETNFRFTLDDGRLSQAQRLFYEENGFLVIPKLLPNDLLDNCYQRFLDIIDGKVEKGLFLPQTLRFITF